MRKNKKIKKILVVIALLSGVLSPLKVFADDLIVGKRDDIYKKLEEAAFANVIANTMRKCVDSIPAPNGSNGITAASAQAGSIFVGTTDISTSMWFEHLVQEDQGWSGWNGSIYCKQSDGKNAFNQFSKMVKIPETDMICNGGSHGLLQRATKISADTYGTSYIYVPAGDKDCNSFNDSGAYYVRADDAKAVFENIYRTWYAEKVKENQYIPSYDELGSFNNMDGYFNYIEDFNTMCKADKVKEDDKVSNTTYYGPITTFNKDGNKIEAQQYYYHLNQYTTWAYPLASGGPTGCSGLLNRISELESKGNGIPFQGRDAGYENIMLDELNTSCKTALDNSDLKERIDKILDNPDAPADLRAKAQERLNELNAAVSSGNYIKGSDEGNGLIVYECAVETDIEDYTPTTPGPGAAIEDPEESDINCMSSGAANTLGWIVCPVLQWLSDAAESLYNGYVEPALRVEPALFKGGTTTEKAWESFRDIANTIFVILLLLVIFSQLTGYGIDNYGIKKILPKLIVAAVLINLSYLICQICVDLSNIIGNGLQDFLDGLGNGLGMPTSIGGVPIKSGVTGSSVGSTLLWGVVILASFVIGIWGVVSSMSGGSSIIGGILLMLLMTAISIVVSIVFLFIILAARQASIVVLTVLSPLAFACFILPNTKRVFDKWLRFGWSLLLVYPICGLLVGGGNLVSKIMLSAGGVASNNLFMAFTAMIIGVVPIFFIPSVVKSSLAAAGNIGAKLSGIGSKLGGRFSRDTGNFVKSRDSFRRMDNFMGRHSLSARTRTQAVKNTAALTRERGERQRYGSRDSMARTLAAVEASEEAKAYDEATGQTLSLMESTGEGGGITVGGVAHQPLNITNAERRLQELERAGGTRAYTDNERNEMAALARYMAGQKGGATILNNTVRDSANQNFAAAMGDIYRRDGAVQAKMKEKSQAVGQYMDNGDFSRSFNDTADAAFMAGVRANRIKSHEVGLNQGGRDAREYISTLDQSQAQQIMDNDILLNSLDNDIRDAFMAHAATLGVTGKSATTVTGTVGIDGTVQVTEGEIFTIGRSDGNHTYRQNSDGSWSDQANGQRFSQAEFDRIRNRINQQRGS